MARVQAVLSHRSQLVRELATLYKQLRASERQALQRARQIGELLLDVPANERADVLRKARISPRSGRDYTRIAEHWHEVRQHAASIRQALTVLRRPPPRVGPFLWLDWPGLFEASRLRPITEYVDVKGRLRQIPQP